MNSTTLFQLSLLTHITCFAAIAGGALADFTINTRLGKYLANDRQKALAILDSTAAIPKIFMFGGIFLIISGILMIVAMHGAFVSMTWFKIKMCLVVLIILNPIVFARPNAAKLQTLLKGNDNYKEILTVKSKLTRFYISQLLLVLIVFTLSVFQF